MKLPEPKILAKDLKIKGYYKMRKAVLQAAIDSKRAQIRRAQIATQVEQNRVHTAGLTRYERLQSLRLQKSGWEKRRILPKLQARERKISNFLKTAMGSQKTRMTRIREFARKIKEGKQNMPLRQPLAKQIGQRIRARVGQNRVLYRHIADKVLLV